MSPSNGMRRTMNAASRRRQSAFHEAGHATAMILYRVFFRYVDIKIREVDGEWSGGAVHLPSRQVVRQAFTQADRRGNPVERPFIRNPNLNAPRRVTAARAQSMVKAAWAGVLAVEAVLKPWSRRKWETVGKTWGLMKGTSDLWFRDQYLPHAREEETMLLVEARRDLEEATPAITAVAENLLAVGRLSHSEVVHLVVEQLPADSWLWVTSHLKDYAPVARSGGPARRR
jgi:hypothetical protein